MFHPIMAVIVFLLFFLLTPGVIVRLPFGGSRIVVAMTHAVIFTFILSVACQVVLKMLSQTENIYMLS